MFVVHIFLENTRSITGAVCPPAHLFLPAAEKVVPRCFGGWTVREGSALLFPQLPGNRRKQATALR